MDQPDQDSDQQQLEALSGKKLLWVEDDHQLNQIMEKWLSKYGLQLKHTTHGERALKMIAEDPPDIILIDILLPDINGFQILERLKADERLQDIPTIMFSNLSSDTDIAQGKELGADRFIVKSTIFLDSLAQEIVQVLEEKGRL